MRSLRTGLAAWALLMLSGTVDGHSRPNVSGHWVGVLPQENAGEEIDVTHTETTLTEAHAKEHAITHKLEGTHSG